MLDIGNVLVHAAFKVVLGPSLQLGKALLDGFTDLLGEFEGCDAVLNLISCSIDIGTEYNLGFF